MREKSEISPDIRKPVSRTAFSGLLLGVGVVAAALTSGVGYRNGWWHHTMGLQIFEWSVYGAVLAFVLSTMGLVSARPRGRRRGFGVGIVGAAVALPIMFMAVYWEYAARTYPPINDITTDPEDPPAFWDVPNPVEYPGPDTAALQRTGYPDLTPLTLAISPEKAFEHALALAEETGWEIVAAEGEEGRIEATDTTLLYGFKDDVVVRVTTSSDSGARVDVRSRSRIGRIDRGVNARRIRVYLDALQERVATSAR